jgi:hypothetical protein
MMNFSLRPFQFQGKYIYFTDTKQNTVIPNSTFTRIMYSTPIMTMTGIYLNIQLCIKSVEKHFNNYYFMFDPLQEHNKQIIDRVRLIETDILSKWSTTNNKKQALNLSNQLETGNVSIWLSSDSVDKKQYHEFILKISGIWENEDQQEYGITYKFI